MISVGKCYKGFVKYIFAGFLRLVTWILDYCTLSWNFPSAQRKILVVVYSVSS